MAATTSEESILIDCVVADEKEYLIIDGISLVSSNLSIIHQNDTSGNICVSEHARPVTSGC